MSKASNECVKYKKRGEIAERMRPLSPKRGKMRYGIFSAVVCLSVLFGLIFAVLGGADNSFYELAVKLGLGGFFQNGAEVTPPTVLPDDDTNTVDVETESEAEAETVPEEVTDEEDRNDALTEIIVEDMSALELGGSYFVNYSSKSVDVEGLLAEGFGGDEYNYSREPAVMIVHSYTSTGYFDLNDEDDVGILKSGVVAMGARIVEELTLRGVPAVHVTAIHDGNGEDDPYGRTAETVEAMLDVYPSVRLVIDLGRMDVRDGDGRPIKLLSNHGEAQIRLTVSANSQEWQEDMALALELRSLLNNNEKRLCLPVTLSESTYSSGKSKYYLKVDIGTAFNSSNEAALASDALADALIEVMKK